MDGMEITQFTYFQQAGGLECFPVSGEITYGLERLALYLQGVEDFAQLIWSKSGKALVTYADVFHQYEVEMSCYNFDESNVPALFQQFELFEAETSRLLEAGLPLPAYEFVMKASHTFNLLDARHAISVTERQQYLLRVRSLSRAVALAYLESRRQLGFPLAEASIKQAFLEETNREGE